MSSTAGLAVVTTGLSTMVQDLGRDGYGRYGLAPVGAMDASAFRWANLLVGNKPGCAALEFNQLGPTLRWNGPEPLLVALTGATFAATLGPDRATSWRSFWLAPGTELRLGACGAGLYGYLAVAGGIAVPEAFGSRSTDQRGRIGGIEGRALRDGDVIPVTSTRSTPSGCLALPANLVPEYGDEVIVRVVLGTQDDRFTDDAVVTFLSSKYRVTREIDRMGVRLDGPPLTFKAGAAGADILSEGVVTGAIQVPSHGLPIVLLAAHQTTGGYSKIAAVIEADLPRVAQARPGVAIRFRRVSVAEARQALLAYRTSFSADRLMPVSDAGSADTNDGSGELTPTGEHGEIASVTSGIANWGPDSVRLLLERIAELGFSEFEFAHADVRIRARRDVASADSTGASPGSEPATANDTRPPTPYETLAAPFLGVYYAAAREGNAPLARVDDVVERGQTLGLIEVMKTFHPIQAPRRARVARIDVEDGQPVEFGQPLFALEPLLGDETSAAEDRNA